ncbi:RrF2 family transcriptional regulator, partial [Bacteroidota bacterium]
IIAKSNKKLNVNEIAKKNQSSRHHIAKVMQQLNKKNIVKSTRGPKGGFELNKKPENITLLEVYEIIDGKIEVSSCPMEYTDCKYKNCVFSDLASKINSDFIKYLEEHTIADFSMN